jgi:hypothetical protein
MRKTNALVLASLLGSATVAVAGPPNNNNQQKPVQIDPTLQQQQPGSHVDLVIALDTSSSMNGLIDAAREKLWDVVSLLSTAQPRPILRVGLISYGNDGYRSSDGWVRKESDLTTDLDAIYAKLFALSTNGGSEYVARAVHDATTDMKWEQAPKTLKVIFVAGNEPANQDPKIPVESAVQEARERGIFVNTIYCGSPGSGEARLWAEVAHLGSGKYASIDHNHRVAIATPMDADLTRLSGELNKTYVGYGAGGDAAAANQKAQDENAKSMGSSASAGRAAAKGSKLYDNSRWDLVDAAAKDKKVVAAKPATELPPEMRAMKPAEREEYIATKAKKRAEIQKEIAEKSAQRNAYIKAERGKHKGARPDIEDAFDDAIRSEAAPMGITVH